MDFRFSQDVNLFIANSKTVQDRIKRYYKRDSEIIYPPVTTDRYVATTHSKDGYYVVLGRQVAYKRLDLVVDAFNILGLPVKVAGTGEELNVQRPRAKNNIEFLGRVEDAELPSLFAGARALIFPAEEDFGIVPVEAMAAGVPVIAYGVGGATETVIEGLSGTLFYEQTPEALIAAVRAFDDMSFSSEAIRLHAQTFDAAVFSRRLKAYVDQAWTQFTKDKTIT
jgi:glycosyltransferase involved in cell wall biosynthesis